MRNRFIGTERGNILSGIPVTALKRNNELFPKIEMLREKDSRAAAIVDRYFCDMVRAIHTINAVLLPGGTFVLVCGDNLVAGQRIPTWQILNSMAEERGLVLHQQFGDKIERRHVPPQRNGHKGLIKQEVVSIFVKPRKGATR